jgi:hypothetical protein
MAFNKTLKSEAEVVIIGGNQKDLFDIGFEYMAHGHVYKVTDRFYQDNTEWRRLRADDGTLEDVTVSTILEDLNTGRPLTKKGVMKAFRPERDSHVAILKNPRQEEAQKAAKQAEEDAAEAQRQADKAELENFRREAAEKAAQPVAKKQRLLKKVESKSAKVIKPKRKSAN